MSEVTQIFSDDIVQELQSNNYTQDRLPGDLLTLPETLYDIKIKVNDFVVSETINYSLSKLYNNWLYLISKSIIPSNNIPNSDYTEWMIVDDSTGGLTWKDTFTNSPGVPGYLSFRTAATNTGGSGWSNEQSIFDGVNQLSKIRNIADPDNYNIVANTSTNIILLSGSGTSSIDLIGNFFNNNNPIYSDSDVTHPSNEILFENIANHVITQDNDLFVLDKNHKTIFKFDISGILTLDRAILQNDTPGRLMTGMMGGPGELTDKTRFTNPMMMETVDNLIYTIDHSASESIIKVFDSDLNWKQSVSVGNTLSAGPLHISYNDQTERFYILCHVRSTAALAGNTNLPLSQARLPAELVILDKNLQYITTSPLNDDTYSTRINTEQYRKVYFSQQNKNIMYVVTDKNVFKKYVSRPERFIGQFLLSDKNIGAGDGQSSFEDMTIFPATKTQDGAVLRKDEILLLDGRYRTVFQLFEDSNYERSLQTEFDDKALLFSGMQVQDDEYVSTLTYNKVLTKHMYNNMLLLENTYRKFSTQFNSNGISQYIGFKYLNQDELQQINYTTPLDAYIGNNELLLSETINRCLNQILVLQENVLDKMQEKSINVFPLLTAPVLLTSPYIDDDAIAAADFDSDGLPDSVDPDDDNDGIPDAQDDTTSLNLDRDSDGLTDYQEFVLGTDPDDDDTDDDSVLDGVDIYPLNPAISKDLDSDGTPDAYDQDADGDGVHDSNKGGTDQHYATVSDWRKVDGVDLDDDGIDDVIDIDIDNDKYLNHDFRNIYLVNPTGTRYLYGNNPTVAKQLALMTINDDAVDANSYYVQTDSAGIPLTDGSGQFIAIVENQTSFDSLSTRATGIDFDQDGVDDVIDTDDDNDLVLDEQEITGWLSEMRDSDQNRIRVFSDPFDPDTDDDTLSDLQEYELKTNPASIDTDGDMDLYTIDQDGNIVTVGVSGRDDQDEFPVDPAGYRDTDGDGKPDEFTHTGIDYTDPATPVLSGRVASTSQTPLEEDLDDDDDQLSDVDEIEFGSDPKLKDTDGDGLDDKQEFDAGTNPRDARAHLAEPPVFDGTIAVLSQVTQPETFSGTLSSLAELNNLFLNSDYLSSTPYTFADIDNETNSNELFTLNTIQHLSGVELTNPVDFDTGNTSLTAMFQAHDQSSNVIPGDNQAFVIQLEITDVIEDTDGDGILDPEDDTPPTAALQFKPDVVDQVLQTDSNGVVTRVRINHNIKTEAIEENDAAVVLNANLDDLFVNPEFRAGNAYQLIGGQSGQAGEINGTQLKLKTFDFESLFNTPNDRESRAVQIKTQVTDSGSNQIDIWYQVWVKNTDNEDTDLDGILDFEDLTKDSAQLQLSGGEYGTVVGDNMTVNWPVSVYENMTEDTDLVRLSNYFDNPSHLKQSGPFEITSGESHYEIDSTTSMLQLLSGIDFEAIPGVDPESRYVTAVIQASGQEEPAVTQTITFNVSVTNETLHNTGKWRESDVTWETVESIWYDLSGI